MLGPKKKEKRAWKIKINRESCSRLLGQSSQLFHYTLKILKIFDGLPREKDMFDDAVLFGDQFLL